MSSQENQIVYQQEVAIMADVRNLKNFVKVQ